MTGAEARKGQTDQEYKKLMCLFNSFFKFNLAEEMQMIKKIFLGPQSERVYLYCNGDALAEDFLQVLEVFRKKGVYFRPADYSCAIDQFEHFFIDRVKNLEDVLIYAPKRVSGGIKIRCKVCTIDKLLEQKLDSL